MLRQQIGEFADYAAGIQRLQIALREAAGSEAEFERALEGARRGVERLNVPQEVATRSMTRLTAAVKGAGGTVNDAILVFNNVTAAIKGTGGSAQDIDGAMTALVQVFSKGKVSAEELSGQLGERLAGAVTRFADANNMSLQELQDALKKGEVGLEELMNFIIKLGDDFNGVGEKIAKSSQDAGARLQIAFNDMKIEVGTALQPIGAQFQDAFAEFVSDIAPTLVSVLPAIGQALLVVSNNVDVLAASLVGLGLVVVVNKLVAIHAGVGILSTNIAALNGLIAGTAKAIGFVTAALATNPFTVAAVAAAALGVAVFKANKNIEDFNDLIKDAPVDTLKGKIKDLKEEVAKTEMALLRMGVASQITLQGETRGSIGQSVLNEKLRTLEAN